MQVRSTRRSHPGRRPARSLFARDASARAASTVPPLARDDAGVQPAAQAMSRRSRLLCSVLFALGTVLALALPSHAFATRVFVDPGHGGRYSGATYGGYREANVNLWLAHDVYDVLVARGYESKMSRSTDTVMTTRDVPTWHWNDANSEYRYYADGRTGAYPIPYDDLQTRCDIANAWGADVFVSIHNNAAGSSARGTETYYNWDNETDALLSEKLAKYVQGEMILATGMPDRGYHDMGFYVVKWANMPGVLIEGGFMSNATDRALLLNPQFRRRMAEGIVNGIDRFMAEDPFKPLYPRYGGRTRYGTAAAIAMGGWAPDPAASASLEAVDTDPWTPPASEEPTESEEPTDSVEPTPTPEPEPDPLTPTVLLASGTNWPDALAATPLASKLDAPILLTRPSDLPTETADALRKLAPSQIIVLGGTGAVSDTVIAQVLQETGRPQESVRRIAGVDRYETAALIAEEVGVPDNGKVMLVSGQSFPDALSAASYAGIAQRPILLTKRDWLPSPLPAYFASHAGEIELAAVIGGTGVVSGLVTDALERGGIAAARISGPDRYATNLAVVRAYWDSSHFSPFVATGKDFPDALCAGVLAAKERQPVFLTPAGTLGGVQREYLMRNEFHLDGFTMIGGQRLYPESFEWVIRKALRRH